MYLGLDSGPDHFLSKELYIHIHISPDFDLEKLLFCRVTNYVPYSLQFVLDSKLTTIFTSVIKWLLVLINYILCRLNWTVSGI